MAIMKQFLLISLISIVSCAPKPKFSIDYYSHIKDVKARNIIRACIVNSGGMDRWNSIKELSYSKKYALLLENGHVEKSFDQIHNYNYSNDHIWIQSIENGDTIITQKIGSKYQRSKNGLALDIAESKLKKSINVALYVTGIPYKLTESGAKITYIGEESISGQLVDVIEVDYNANRHAHHSSSNMWRFYFDKKDHSLVANWVDAGDHYSFIENVTTERFDNIVFNKYRKSYRVDSLGNKLYTRAEYYYKNYKIQY